jgi:two-component system, NtrC family, sensor kinase
MASEPSGSPLLRWLLAHLPGRRSIRMRLLALAIVPMGIAFPLLMGVLTSWGDTYFDRVLISRVRSDLAVAHGYFERVTEASHWSIESLAASERLAQVLRVQEGREQALHLILTENREEHGLDFLLLLDLQGRDQAGSGVDLSRWRVVQEALHGHGGAAMDVFSPALLASLGPQLPEQARVAVISASGGPTGKQEGRGLVVHSAAPVRDAQGHLIGVLAGGTLLNNNLDFIDRLNEVVYPEDSLPLGSHGTATLFLDDVRVATNVRLFQGERAMGTQVSDQVRDAVLRQGKVWLDRAFVVQDWYVSAYRPLVDSQGQRIGMLYVGFLEAPLVQAKHGVILGVGLLFGLVAAAATLVAIFWARQLSHPIERIQATLNAQQAGDGAARVGAVDTGDEVGDLAAHLDRLLDQLHAQASALQRWGEALDEKVASRTSDLSRALADLRSAQHQLVMQEKLAAVGQLTAGVAHEVNNPVAVIQGNLEVLQEVLGPAACKPVEGEIRLIREQVQRIRVIIAKLLQFARPTDYVGYLEPIDCRSLVQDCLLLVGHLLRRGHVSVSQNLQSGRLVTCSKTELQQVLINLLVNAVQAMPEGGSLTLAVEDWDEADMPFGVRLSVADSGPGIPADRIDKLFQPFFTADKPNGTGLGLWVSQSLVERYGGRITAENRPEGGCQFSVWLRQEPLAGP